MKTLTKYTMKRQKKYNEDVLGELNAMCGKTMQYQLPNKRKIKHA